MFMHPWAVVLGFAAVVLPVAVHWLTKPRPVRMPLSTLRFVRQAVRQHRARHRLRDVIVLALRAAAILLVAFAIARPKLGEEPLVSESQAGSAVRVVVLDVSQSMAALHHGVEAIERARTIAAGHLRYRPGLRVNLILAGASARTTFAQPSQNFEALRQELSQAQVRPERLDINRAIAKAAEMLAADSEDDRQRRELVVISDFQRSNWARADFSPLPRQTQIQMEATSGDATPANIAILRSQLQQRTAIGGATQVEIEIGNYSPLPRRITAEVAIGEQTFRVEGMCPPDRRTTLVQEIQLQQAGWQVAVARLVGVEDALAADDQRAFVVEVTARPTYALLTRQSASQRPSSSYYLERGLAPDSQLGEQASVEIVRVDPADIDRESLAAADLLVIDHPGKFAAADISLLADLLRRGRPVLYVASEAVDATNLRLLVEAAGGGLQMPVDFAPPRDQPRRDLFLTSVRQDVAPFEVFGDSRQAITGPLRFGGGLNSVRVENTLDDDLLATYSDGTACLVLTSSDAGALAVLNADLSRSNLPTSEAFVPLLDQLVQRLLQRRAAMPGATGGEPVVVRLPNGIGTASELQIVGPEPSENAMLAHGEIVDQGGGVVWRWTSPDKPGVYRVLRGDQTVFALPVGLSAEESPLESISPDVLKNRLAGTLAVHYRSATDPSGQRDVLWTWLLVACVVCIVGEFVSLTAFRS